MADNPLERCIDGQLWRSAHLLWRDDLRTGDTVDQLLRHMSAAQDREAIERSGKRMPVAKAKAAPPASKEQCWDALAAWCRARDRKQALAREDAVPAVTSAVLRERAARTAGVTPTTTDTPDIGEYNSE